MRFESHWGIWFLLGSWTETDAFRLRSTCGEDNARFVGGAALGAIKWDRRLLVIVLVLVSRGRDFGIFPRTIRYDPAVSEQAMSIPRGSRDAFQPSNFFGTWNLDHGTLT